jgi:hypothetical protein
MGQLGLSDALRRLPDAKASRRAPRLLERSSCPIKMIAFKRKVL